MQTPEEFSPPTALDYEAVRQALDTHRPLLLIAGLAATHGHLEEWLNNRALPLAHQPPYC